jgi:predicted nucleic acid-binding protein
MIDRFFGSTVYLDSNIVIYFVEESAAYSMRAKQFISRLVADGAKLITSELTVAECLYKPYRDGDLDGVELFRAMFNSDLIGLYPLTGDLAIRATEHGGELQLKLVDCIHYVSALEAGCDFFVTADARFRSSQFLEVVGI